jgi:hypothetical protein
MIYRCLGQAVVVGEECANLLPDTESGSQVQGIETSQPRRVNRGSLIEHRVVERQQRHVGDKGSGVIGVLRAITLASSNRLQAEQGTGHVAIPFGKLRKQRIQLSLMKRQLHIGRAVQIGEPSRYSRSSRTSSRTRRLGGPAADGRAEPRTRESRSPRGIVAPRSAARRAIGESAGPEGVSRATSLPRSVTTKLSPALTWTR